MQNKGCENGSESQGNIIADYLWCMTDIFARKNNNFHKSFVLVEALKWNFCFYFYLLLFWILFWHSIVTKALEFLFATYLVIAFRKRGTFTESHI